MTDQFQDPHGGLYLLLALVPGNLEPSSDLPKYTCSTLTHMQAKHLGVGGCYETDFWWLYLYVLASSYNEAAPIVLI